MSQHHYFSDNNIHTTAFTPRDYQVELLASAIENNSIICIGHKSSKQFIVLKLIQESATELRSSIHKTHAIYLTSNIEDKTIYNLIYHLSDLKVFLENFTDGDYDEGDNDSDTIDDNASAEASTEENSETNIRNKNFYKNFNILILQPNTFYNILRLNIINFSNINILIIDNFNYNLDKDMIFDNILSEYYLNSNKKTKILSFIGPIHSGKPERLTEVLDIYEKNLYCKIETASDIVTVLRYCNKPKEYIIECAALEINDLTNFVENSINNKKKFIQDHRYDPSEIYSDEFLEELKSIPDPKIEPLEFLNTYLEILNEMGPWCADRIAFNLLTQIEKQKVKTPYERHFLLLCLASSALVEIRSYCEYVFQRLPTELDRILKYSSPKVHRLFDVLRGFKPDENKLDNKVLAKIYKDFDNINFPKLQQTIETKCLHVNETNRDTREVVEQLQNTMHDGNVNSRLTTNRNQLIDTKMKNQNSRNYNKSEYKFKHNVNNRQKRKYHSGNRRHKDVDAESQLCGILYCDKKNTAKVLFDLLCEMSRHDPSLSFLCVQYTVDRVADPITEPKEAESEHRMQEDVLKRFRMHDCNLLIGTSVLEEGIDLPKCNLVIRWDPPKSYRSYVQCMGRARANQAHYVILVGSDRKLREINENELHESDDEILSDYCHRQLCLAENNVESKKQRDKHFKGKKIDISLPTNPEVEKVNKEETLKPSSMNICNNENNVDNKLEQNQDGPNEIVEEEVLNHSNSKECNGESQSNNRLEQDESIQAPKLIETEIKHNGILNLEIDKQIDCDVSLKNIKLLNDLNTSNLPSEDSELSIESLNKISSTDSYENDIKLSNGHDTVESNSNNELNNLNYKNKVTRPSNNDLTKSETKPFKCKVNENISFKDLISKYSLDSMNQDVDKVIDRLAQYRIIEQILIDKCSNREPSLSDHIHADKCTSLIEPYKPLPNLLTGALVDLSTSVALVNKYCAKLPSDTFTKLTPIWRCAKTKRNDLYVYQYTVRLPINSPLKYDIIGVPMPDQILARRMAALLTCRELHQMGELDNNLQPIGKESFRASEPDWEAFDLEENDEMIVNENSEPRPGTTKRRQYYYKRIASEFSNCRPTAGIPAYLYFINLTLQCPIPEEQNTRGRKIYPPEEAQQGFGILTLKKIPKISAFPIFTRSGEVKVSIELCKEHIILTEEQVSMINIFINYTFTNVLRLQKLLMLFDGNATENSIFIVPTIKALNEIKSNNDFERKIDWEFLDVICTNCDKMPKPVPDEWRNGKEFNASCFKDAVVMPWYRNQDQPQYFYVAEICYHLSPESSFPGENYSTFQEYYFRKYNITIQNTKQPLLDVDHTSARLNFLTPRYVNRKGVALPTSSEETKRAKRENLEQKQILVPELCTIHPFPASLWRAAVCLPCILYRINGLLLADEIRKKVSFDLGLGQQEINDESFEWPMLDFGWSLSEVLRKCRDSKKISDEIPEAPKTNENQKNDVSKEKIVESDDILEKDKPEIKSANDILAEADEKLKADSFIEIGTWSNDMANNIDSDFEEDDWGLLPPNINLCSSNNTNIRYGSPTSWDVRRTSTSVLNNGNNQANSKYYSDSDISSDDDYDAPSSSSNNPDQPGTIRIEFKSNNVAEAIETEEEIQIRQKQLAIIQESSLNERQYELMKNVEFGFEFQNLPAKELTNQYHENIIKIKLEIEANNVIGPDSKILLKSRKDNNLSFIENYLPNLKSLQSFILPYMTEEDIQLFLKNKRINYDSNLVTLTFDELDELNSLYLRKSLTEEYFVVGTGSVFDNFNDDGSRNDTKSIVIKFDGSNKNLKGINENGSLRSGCGIADSNLGIDFSFDYQPDLNGHPGPSPSIILQAVTMSNANDGINLERLETIGDSFLKYAITSYLYCTYENVHEGKLSHLRSKQVSNLNLYRLGRKKVLGECMIATKFEPHDNWLPPCYYVPKELEKALIEAKIPPSHWNLADLPNIKELSSEEICAMVRKKAEALGLLDEDDIDSINEPSINNDDTGENFACFIPYNLVTQHSIPDKSIADCVEALIGAYLIECGPRGALLFMAWLGIRVLPTEKTLFKSDAPRIPGSTKPNESNEIAVYGEWKAPKSPLLTYSPNALKQLDFLLDGFSQFEYEIGYFFQDRSYLLQAMTHASYSPNRLTDCYQRLEFLGDAVLDYLITRHLYEDPRQHSPGALTDLRSALVNNTIFASLAVRHGFHKYFRHLSPGLNEVIDRFVRIQHENGHIISEEYYLLSEEECDDAEDVEVPKALGDVFESVAGAVFLDSNMSLDTVWKVYSNMMKPEIEQFSNSVPKSPIRELLELEPETAKFGRPEKLADGRRVRVTVEVFGKGTFRGIGRNYRIAKCTAAKCALRQLKKQGLISKKH